MKEYASYLAGPVCLLLLLCGVAILLGTDPWRVASAVMICLPVDGYVVVSIFAVMWAIKVGEVGAHQNMSFQSKFYFWHGVSVVLCIALAAGGSFIVLFALLMKGVLGGPPG